MVPRPVGTSMTTPVAPARTTSNFMAAMSSMSYLQCKNMQYNVIIIGWLGVIISASVLMTTLMSMQWQPELEQLIKDAFLKDITKSQQEFLTNFLAGFNTALYVLSLINIIVSLLLIIGITRDSNTLIYPWLIFHGMMFGVGIYVSIFYLAAGFSIDLSSFVLCILIFTLVMVLFYKTYQEVFSLFKVMESQKNAKNINLNDVERALHQLNPYPTLYMPSI